MNVWARADVPPPRPNSAFFADALAQPFTQARFATPPAASAASNWSGESVLAVAMTIWAAGACILIGHRLSLPSAAKKYRPGSVAR